MGHSRIRNFLKGQNFPRVKLNLLRVKKLYIKTFEETILGFDRNKIQVSLAIMIMSYRSLCGIHILSYFRESIFQDAGMKDPKLWACLASFIAILDACFTGFLAILVSRR